MRQRQSALNGGLTKAVRYLRSPLSLFILVNIPFFLIFYDVWNLNTIFSAASYLSIGLNPYQYNNQIPGGLLIQLLGVAAYSVFRSSQSSFLLAASLFKILYLTLTFSCGVVLSRIAQLEGLKYHRKILYAFIFNPFLLFINNVWVETDIIAIFLYVVGYAALYYGWERGEELRYLVLGGLCIVLAIFNYYSLLLLLPTLILYRSSLRKRLQTLLVFLGLGALLGLPLIVFQLTAVSGLSSNLQSPAVGISPYALFSLAEPFSAASLVALDQAALVAILAASFIVPIVLKRYGVQEPVALLASYSVPYLLFVNTVQGDNFVLLIGLLMLAIISLRLDSLSYKRIFALQLFLLPEFVVAELFDGVKGTDGVFYWSYYQFHASPDLYTILGGRTLWHTLLILYAILLCLTLGYLLLRRNRRAAVPDARGFMRPAPKTTPGPHGRPVPLASTALWAAVVLLVAVVPVAIAIDPGVGQPSGSVSSFDAGLFLPLEFGSECNEPPQCAYLLSSALTYSVDGANSSVHVASTSVPIGLYRNVTDQSFTIGLTAQVHWENTNQSEESMEFVNTSNFYAGLGTALVVNNSSLLAPTVDSPALPVINATSPILLGAGRQFEFDGRGILTYALTPPALVGRELVFGAELSRHAENQDFLWDIIGTSASYEAYLHDNEFYLASRAAPNAPWQYESSAMVMPLGQWFRTGFEVTPSASTLSGFVNGQTLTEPYLLGTSSVVSVNVGKYNDSASYDGQESLSGRTTGIYLVSPSSVEHRPFAYVWSSVTGSLVTFPFADPLPVTLSGTYSAPVLTIEGTATPVSPFPSLWLGKLTDSGSSVDLTFRQFDIASATSGPNLLWVSLDLALGVPGVIAVWCFGPFLTKDRRGVWPFRQ
ncbi:MAG: hypothetical protein ACLP8Y_01140 [Thermoplasmata archaeon]